MATRLVVPRAAAAPPGAAGLTSAALPYEYWALLTAPIVLFFRERKLVQ